jgi:long-chain acyl-CoA synthetase
MKVRGVTEVFVHGDSLQSYTVAIVVPDQQYILDLAASKKITGSFEELCKNPEILKSFLESLDKQGRADKLIGFELAKKLYLHPETMANLGCMTNTMKL